MFLLSIVLFALLGLANCENNDVVVLVHGYNGNSGTWAYADELRQSGLRVITLTIPPTASNHDRAASLFAQLKGRRIDHGVCHSAKFGIDRFGEDYTGKGLYPEWDSNNRAHFIGHSMGGQTIRALERLLELGSGCDEDTDLLYTGGNDWITSITTLATPHDGTTAVNIGGLRRGEYLMNTIIEQGIKVDDLGIPHMGLVRGEDETREEFFDRLLDVFNNQENNALYDLSIEGAALFNSNGPAIVNKNTYYMAYSNDRTSPGDNCRFRIGCDPFEVPDPGMSFQLKVPAGLIGRESNPADRPNDGAVNKDRSKCPGDTRECKEVPDDITAWAPGQWHYINIDYLDHYQITRRDSDNDDTNFLRSAERMYLQIGSRLKSLPSRSVSRLSPEEEFQASEQADAVRSYLEAVAFITSLPAPDRNNHTGAAVLFIFIVGSVLVGGYFVAKRIKKEKSTSTSTPSEGEVYHATL